MRTQTSLQYAARVKLITNSAEKAQESAEVARLKAQIAALRAGRAGAATAGGVALADDAADAPPADEALPPPPPAGGEAEGGAEGEAERWDDWGAELPSEGLEAVQSGAAAAAAAAGDKPFDTGVDVVEALGSGPRTRPEGTSATAGS